MKATTTTGTNEVRGGGEDVEDSECEPRVRRRRLNRGRSDTIKSVCTGGEEFCNRGDGLRERRR